MHAMVFQLFLLLLIAAITTAAGAGAGAEAGAPPLARLGCSSKCGDLTVPFPFGMSEGCRHTRDKFFINCSVEDSTGRRTAYLMTGNIPVTNINLEKGELQIKPRISYRCYEKGKVVETGERELSVDPFTISSTRNKFIAAGCDTNAIFSGYRGEQEYFSGCISFCESLSSVDAPGSESCSGIGCCQSLIPSGLEKQTVTLKSYNNHTDIGDFNPCDYAFILEDGQFNFSGSRSFEELNKTARFPMVLNWEIGDGTCTEAAKKGVDYACRAKNTMCVDRAINVELKSSGYFCQCLPGYQGNPYLPGGCQDIDECKEAKLANRCKHGKCKNKPGNYSCTCNSGYEHEGQDPYTCIASLRITVGIPLSFCVLLLTIVLVYFELKKRKFKKLKQKYFQDNGGLHLKQELARYKGSVETAARIFTEEELKKATNNYHVSTKVGEGGYGIVYRGTLSDRKVVAIKKSKVSSPITETRQFVNEVIVLSQVIHKNVVRLLGCCLETQTPILVYEFIAHGTLYEHIHRKGDNGWSPLPLERRLKIAADTAEALAYLHYSTSTPIIHRDVKATNILLDQNFMAKVSDFGASRLVPEDENQPSTFVQGTLGYLDPEYLQSNILTEKSDVYSFGVVLVELLTSQKAVSFNKPEAERNLAKVFVCLVEKGCLSQIVDAEIVKEGHFETVTKVADLAKGCLRLRGEDRPSMKKVAAELQELVETMAQHPVGGQADFSRSYKDSDYLLGSPSSSAFFGDVRGGGGDGGCNDIITSAEYGRSMQNQIQMVTPYGDGR